VPEVVVNGRPPLPADEVRRIVERVAEGEGRDEALVSITFVGRDAMRRLNHSYKGRPRPTDVIAFSLPDPARGVVGDVYVCPWYGRREARERGIAEREEMVRLVVHGTLHALGWEHPEDEGRTTSPMWRRQETYVEAFA
jgi:probable rRNA maturation factor